MTSIGLDARLTAYRIGGISTYTRQLADALSRQSHTQQQTYTVFQSRKAEAAISQLPERKLWTPPHHRLERWVLGLEIGRYALDVWHSTDFIPPQWGARKHVITVHDLAFLLLPEHKDQAASRYYNDQIRWAVRHTDHILSVSDATRKDLISLLNVPEEKITVQPHGVSSRFFAQGDNLSLAGLPSDYILFVGTLEPRKNINTLLSAYSRMKDAPPLVLAGKIGWLFEDTLQRIYQMQALGMRIIHRDDITDEALPALYRGASVVVLPSHYEGFGFPVLEAMACGTPVIASDISSLPEVVGDAGLLLPPDDIDAWRDGIEHALTDSAWRTEMIQRGLKQASLFTWEQSAQIAIDVYQKVATS
jgi:glycosyltransferase involved in cell wall biosynthesis